MDGLDGHDELPDIHGGHVLEQVAVALLAGLAATYQIGWSRC